MIQGKKLKSTLTTTSTTPAIARNQNPALVTVTLSGVFTMTLNTSTIPITTGTIGAVDFTPTKLIKRLDLMTLSARL